MKNEVEQIALQNDMSIEFVTWFFNEKKVGCGNVWFMMMAAMWEGWKGRSIEMDKLATENVALKNVFSQKEIPSEAVDAFMETAVMDHDWNETSEWSWVENETEVIHAVLDALKPETPATDRIVAGIKADGVEEFSKTLEGASDICGKSKAWEAQENLLDFAERGFDFAKQLREGDNHD